MSDDPEVLADEEHAELHPRVFGVKAGHELALGFGEIERQRRVSATPAIRKITNPTLGDAKPEALLGLDDRPEIERAGDEHHAHQRQTHEHLVAQHLSRGAQPAEQRVLAVRGPAPEDHAVDAERGHGEKEQQPDVEADDADSGRDRHDRERQQHGHDDHRGRHDEHRPIGERRDPVFLGEDLDRVGDHLQQAERPHAVRPVAVLPERKQSPLHPDEAGRERQSDEEDAKHVQEAMREWAQGVTSARCDGAPGRKRDRRAPQGAPSIVRRRRGECAGDTRSASDQVRSLIASTTMPARRYAERAGVVRVQGERRRGRSLGDSRRELAQLLASRRGCRPGRPATVPHARRTAAAAWRSRRLRRRRRGRARRNRRRAAGRPPPPGTDSAIESSSSPATRRSG